MMKLAVGEVVQGYRITRFLGAVALPPCSRPNEETGNKSP
jgi:hypothetical protein